MKKYIYLVISVIILLILVTVLILICSNKKTKDFSVMNEESNKVQEINSRNINEIELETMPIENLENTENDERQDVKSVEENITERNTLIQEKKVNKEENTNTKKKEETSKKINEKANNVTTKNVENVSQTNNIETNETNTTDNKKNEIKEKESDNINKEVQHTHFMQVNGGWFKTENEAYKKFKMELEKWSEKYKNGEISWDELGKLCPIRI